MPPFSLGLGFSDASAAALSSPFSVYSPINFGASSGGSVSQTGTAIPTSTATASPSVGGSGGLPVYGSSLGNRSPQIYSPAPGTTTASAISPTPLLIGGAAIAALLVLYYFYQK
jgi:hypothetical protein